MVTRTLGPYCVRSLADLLESGCDEQAVMHQLDQIYDSFPNIAHAGNDMGDNAKWTHHNGKLPSVRSLSTGRPWRYRRILDSITGVQRHDGQGPCRREHQQDVFV